VPHLSRAERCATRLERRYHIGHHDHAPSGRANAHATVQRDCIRVLTRRAPREAPGRARRECCSPSIAGTLKSRSDSSGVGICRVRRVFDIAARCALTSLRGRV
jgi:hypothetical protein